MSKPKAHVEDAAADLVSQARVALDGHDWPAAYDLFTRADGAGALSGADLEAFAEAAFFAAHVDAEMELKERAFKARLEAGERVRAAYVALDLGYEYAYIGKPSIGAAWTRRAERLLEGEPEGYAHGYLALAKSGAAMATGDIEAALRLAEEAVQISNRARDADLQATALTALGGLKIQTGDAADGLDLMEEATVAAVNGELSPFKTGVTYCSMIAACRDLTDYRRASEWTEAAERWCQRQSVSGFPGICRVHRAEVVALGGAWERAEAELRQATDELAAYHAIPPMADGLYALGEVRLRMGELGSAETALREAHALGRSPQPALALIRLAEGNPRAALSAIDSAVREEPWNKLVSLRLLPAQIEIAVAAGDVARARAAAEELEQITQNYDSPAIAATRHDGWARVLLAEGDAPAAAAEVRTAIRLWREVAAPYEIARGRALLAAALFRDHDEDAGELELRAARDEFVRLGAKLDAAAVERELEAAGQRRGVPKQARMTFMFTDIVGSTKLAELLGDAAWEQLLAWHDGALRALFVRHGGRVVNSTGDGFFVAFDAARPALDCAIAVQRAFAEHRRTSGFALQVRIGLHSAEATRRGDDYSGVGVHVAARVAALAEGGGIVASAATLDEAGEVAVSDTREATLKGVREPVRVASVSWA